MLAHLIRPCGTVEADRIDAERRDRGQRRTDFTAKQHGAGGLDSHRNENRHALAEFGHRTLSADNGRFGLQQVLNCFD